MFLALLSKFQSIFARIAAKKRIEFRTDNPCNGPNAALIYGLHKCQLRGLDFPDQAMLTELEAIERTSGDQDIAQSMAAWSRASMFQREHEQKK